ncbi:hypothetical protein BCR34DRAFT_264858 [Clohesyomyces aquaticus]|uniref:C2H2-type domain-containing protein n=1 Tax=Clohesyomyces aquaticus TaxID=1231657 RepID=A0A1Y1ZTH8_9PLEO|nr:hypothetical protein BCR34DRAFT_264858 [Clohesyomyces aquaticus]
MIFILEPENPQGLTFVLPLSSILSRVWCLTLFRVHCCCCNLEKIRVGCHAQQFVCIDPTLRQSIPITRWRPREVDYLHVKDRDQIHPVESRAGGCGCPFRSNRCTQHEEISQNRALSPRREHNKPSYRTEDDKLSRGKEDDKSTSRNKDNKPSHHRRQSLKKCVQKVMTTMILPWKSCRPFPSAFHSKARSDHCELSNSHSIRILEAGDQIKHRRVSELDAGPLTRSDPSDRYWGYVTPASFEPPVELPTTSAEPRFERRTGVQTDPYHNFSRETEAAPERNPFPDSLFLPRSGGDRHEDTHANQNISDSVTYQRRDHDPRQSRSPLPALVTSTACTSAATSLCTSSNPWSSGSGNSFAFPASSISTPSAHSSGISSATSGGYCRRASCNSPSPYYWNATRAACSPKHSAWASPTSNSASAPVAAQRSIIAGCQGDCAAGFGSPDQGWYPHTQECQASPAHAFPQAIPLARSPPPIYSSPKSPVRRDLWPRGTQPFGGSANDAANGATSITIYPGQDRRTRLCIEADEQTRPIYVNQEKADVSIQCNECFQRFTGVYRRGNLARHQRMKHNMVDMSVACDVCGKAFKRRDAAKKHEWDKHRHGTPPKPKKRRGGRQSVQGSAGMHELPV